MQPKIDIIVPTYNRPQDIKKYIAEIQEQVYTNFTVWIIDDHGNVPIKSLVPEKKEFKYVRLPENKGQAYARNIPIGSGNGEIIISMDDDAWFDNDKHALVKITGYFDSFPEAGCVMFNIATPLTQYDNIKVKGLELPLHVTCGCAYRRSALEAIGGFSGFIHSAAEETDISLKLIHNNYKILFAPDIKVFHNFNPLVRSAKWYRIFRYNTTRNDLLIIIMRYPFNKIFIYLIGKFCNHVIFDLKRKNYLAALYICLFAPFGFILKLPDALKLRKPLSFKEFIYWRNLFNKQQ
jgi:glycosyltransferase involved in cell wall biosynthesis